MTHRDPNRQTVEEGESDSLKIKMRREWSGVPMEPQKYKSVSGREVTGVD